MQPRSLGPYLLERRLGAGGFAAVWAARHQESGALHALKVIELSSPEEALRFQREAAALLRLEGHPGAVRVHAAFCVGATAVLAMELVEGQGDLASRLKTAGALAPRDAARLVRDVARAVEHAHRRGVLHRDIKPANVLLDAAGRPRLVDLGLAAVSGERSLTRTGEVMGTPGFAAPEQALGRRCDERTDVFGLGALLFACLTGRAPREGPNALGLLLQAGSQPIPSVEALRPDAPPALCALVRRATALNRDDRHPGAAALAGELDAFLGDARPPGRVPWTVAVAVAALLVLGLVGLLLARPSPGRDPAASLPEAAPPRATAPSFAAARARFLAVAEVSEVGAAARALRAALGALSPDELESQREALARAVQGTQARLVQSVSQARDARPEDEAGLAAAWAALAELGEAAGLDARRLLAARRAALDEQAEAWERRVERALESDATRAWTPGVVDDRNPTPALRACFLLLRNVQAPGQAPPALGDRLRLALEELTAQEIERLARTPRDDAWMRRALTLFACDAYRFYGVDRTPSQVLGEWDPGQLPALQGSAWYHLAQVRSGAVRIVDQRLARLDPGLRGLCPGSRLLALSGLEAGDDPGAAGSLVAIALGLAPGAVDDLAPELSMAPRETAREVVARSGVQLAARALIRARELMLRWPEGALSLGAAVEPLVQPALERARALPPEVAARLQLSAGAFLRELGSLRRREVELQRAIALLRSSVAGFRAGESLEVGLWVSEALVELAGALLELEALGPPGAGDLLLTEAEALVGVGMPGASSHDKEGVHWRAIVTRARVLLARRRAEPGLPLGEVEQLLRSYPAVTTQGTPEQSLDQADAWSWGLYGRTLVEAALAASDLELARSRLDAARERAAQHPEWGSGRHLDRLAARLAAPR